jgi:hypothetical protein
MKHFAFNYLESYWLADVTITEFYDDSNSLLEDFWSSSKEQLLPRILKPHKWTIVHDWIFYVFDFHDWYADRHFEPEDIITIQSKIVDDAGFDLPETPDFISLAECDYCDECDECFKYRTIKDFIDQVWTNSVTSLVHTVFHLFMGNKKFLRDFNMHISECIKSDIDFLKNENPKAFAYGKIPRVSWPKWLERALLFRDKGVCSICRKDVSGTLNLENKFAIDHIVPIGNFGCNDPTNLQILCWDCNGRKSNKSNETNNIDIPLWNIETLEIL